jgi:putative membrane protein
VKRPILVLCIDRDNDLYEKAKVSGPLIGREKNLEGAMALSLADPEDPDSNAIYYAVKVFDQMRKEGHNAEVVTLTGDRRLGYKADKEVSSQLDKVMVELNPTSCILISDGASDEEILPIIKSRIKVDSTKIVYIKQAKELEQTYFVLLEKLREPSFAKIVIGIPAALILLMSLSSYLGLGWQPVGIVVGLYLLLRISGTDEMVVGVVRDFRFSFERTSWIGYIGALAIFAIALFVGYQTLQKGTALNLSGEKRLAMLVGNTVWILFIGLLLIMVGKSVDALMERKKYVVTKYILYSAAAGLSTFVMLVGSMWIVNLYEPYVDFGMFLTGIAASLVFGYFVTSLVSWYRKEILVEMKIEGKEAISENGTYLGKIVGVDAKKGKLIIQTIFDKRYGMPISAVTSVDENVILKASD